ncbi:NADPH-dependent FMN reductase [Dermacoccaceae bacterium W4C1]
MKIGIIVGSTRTGRLGSGVGEWVTAQADARADSGVEYELIELDTFDLPLLTEPTVPGAAGRQYETPQTREWGAKIDSLDGLVWVTPEYNHGVPAALKNAFDVLYPEWNNKAIAFVSYGADGGVRAVEHWRTIVVNALMVDVRAQVALSLFTEWPEGKFTPAERRTGELNTLLDQLVAMTGALSTLRG